MPGRTLLFRQVMRALQQSSPGLLLSRREFLRRASAGGAGAVLASCAGTPGRSEEPVAIVGGGVAGLTAAYRLQKAGQSVHLYEAGSRLGGRIFTRRQFNADGQFVELGAELVDSGHKDLIRLARELGLRVQNLVKGEHGRDTFWFEGRRHSEHDVVRAFRPLGERIATDAEGIYDGEGDFTEKARQLDQMSLADYLADRGRDCEPWVVQLLVAAYEPEFGIESERQSSLNLVDFINPDTTGGFQVFGESDEAWRIEGGNSSLPEALQAALAGKVEVRLEQRLRRVDDEAGKIRLEFATDKGPAAYSYERVILTLPFTVLRHVGGIDDLPLSADKKRCIREMGYGNNVKVFRSFRSRVWRQEAAQHAANGSVFAQAHTFQNVWETSRGQTGERGLITNLLGGRRAAQYSEAAMSGYLDELDEVFPGIKAAYDGKAGSMNWPKVATAMGSYSAPLVGQYTWIYEASPTPELDGRLLFAGEHTSLVSPGFMNGGVESGNRAARQVLKGG